MSALTPLCPICGGIMNEAPELVAVLTAGTENIWGLATTKVERRRTFTCHDGRGRLHATTTALERDE